MRIKLLLALALTTPLCDAADTLQRCLDTAMTQDAMNTCAQRDLERADKELNRIYRELQVRYKDDPAFIGRLRTAQTAWIKFRDAQLDMKFPPHPEESNYYGSVFPMCEMLYLQELESDRITMLKEWLKGSGDGDVCSGSLKSPEELGRAKRSRAPAPGRR
jgi:uncharacterized protein YecT (DUF1311 family)